MARKTVFQVLGEIAISYSDKTIKKAQDDARDLGSAYERMANKGKKAFGKIGISAGQMMTSIGRSIPKVGKALGGFAVKGAKALGKVGVAAAGVATAVGAMAVDMAMDLEATEAKFDTVFGAMSDDMIAFGNELQKIIPMTDTEFKTMASGIQDLLIPMGFARDEASEITQKFMHLAGALTAFNSESETMESVTEKLTSALLGETTALASLGIQYNAEQVRLKAVEMGLAESVEAVDKQAEALAMLEIAYSQSGDALSAFNAESLDSKTKMEISKNATKELITALGTGLLGAFQGLIDNGYKRATEGNEELAEKLTNLGTVVGTFLVNAIGLAKDLLLGLWDVIQQGIEWIDSLSITFEPLKNILQSLAETILPLLQTAFNAFMENVVPVVSEGIQNIITALEPFMTALGELMDVILPALSTAFQVAIDIIIPIMQHFVNMVTTSIASAIEILTSIINFLVDIFTGDWEGAWESVKEIFSTIWEAIKNIARTMMNGIIDIINGAIKGLNKIQIPDWVPGVGGKGLNIPEIPKLAEGGTIQQSGSVIVGEQGAELLTLPQGATVAPLPNNKKPSQNIINININEPTIRDDNDVDKLVKTISREMNRILSNKGMMI